MSVNPRITVANNDTPLWELKTVGGNPGVTGPAGPVGGSVVLFGQVASPAGLPTTSLQNHGYSVLSDNDLYVYGPTGWVNCGLFQGDTGTQGPTGIQGVQGPVGVQGFSGPVGPIGLPGDQGPQGPQGNQGPSGPIGIQGPTGPQGVTGPIGTSYVTPFYVEQFAFDQTVTSVGSVGKWIQWTDILVPNYVFQCRYMLLTFPSLCVSTQNGVQNTQWSITFGAVAGNTNFVPDPLDKPVTYKNYRSTYDSPMASFINPVFLLTKGVDYLGTVNEGKFKIYFLPTINNPVFTVGNSYFQLLAFP